MKIVVDHDQRFAKMRAHTATHLLHAELAKIFPGTKQAGSMVDSDILRFDFNTDRLLTPAEIITIEKHINQIIYDALPVQTTETSLTEASKL
jgi:alanyl-tRNA synthetase